MPAPALTPPPCRLRRQPLRRSHLPRPASHRSARWEDGELVKKELAEPSRWDVHSADEVAVTLGELRLRIIQQVLGDVGVKGLLGSSWWTHRQQQGCARALGRLA